MVVTVPRVFVTLGVQGLRRNAAADMLEVIAVMTFTRVIRRTSIVAMLMLRVPVHI